MYDSDSSGNYTCPKCKSEYRIHQGHVPMRDKDQINCDICGDLIKRWNGSRVFNAELLKAGEKPKQE